jgi:anionic cell wall polymer biosynthesis LytR-Cps2A-Psr (LCP) family protein
LSKEHLTEEKVGSFFFRGLGVDAVGGVTVDNPFKFSDAGFTFNEGEIEPNGEIALAYSRMRYQDPRGDFGRQDRQKQIIMKIIQKGATFTSLRKNDLLGVLGQNIRLMKWWIFK